MDSVDVNLNRPFCFQDNHVSYQVPLFTAAIAHGTVVYQFAQASPAM